MCTGDGLFKIKIWVELTLKVYYNATTTKSPTRIIV